MCIPFSTFSCEACKNMKESSPNTVLSILPQMPKTPKYQPMIEWFLCYDATTLVQKEHQKGRCCAFQVRNIPATSISVHLYVPSLGHTEEQDVTLSYISKLRLTLSNNRTIGYNLLVTSIDRSI